MGRVEGVVIEPSEESPLFDSTPQKGEVQTSRCNDAFFAILFYAQFIAITALAIVYGIPAIKQINEANSDGAVIPPSASIAEDVEYDASGFLYLSYVAIGTSIALTVISIPIMACLGKMLIILSLLFTIFSGFGLAIASYLTQNTVGIVTGVAFGVLGTIYAIFVRNRIPFAAANLNAGIKAVKSNGGVVVLSYLFIFVLFGWLILWSISTLGFTNLLVSQDCNDDDDDCAYDQTEVGIYTFLFLLSLFWTAQVIKNVQHCTLAGVVGTWWFDPSEARSFCSTAIWASFTRSITYSFGSICFGSLLTAIITTLHAMVEAARQESDEASLLLCIVDCILSLLENIVEYFNKWAYIYVGLYGYSYLEAGKKVIGLFKGRGWTAIINDNLVSNALGLVSATIGLLTGAIGFMVDKVHSDWLSDLEENSPYVAFTLCFFIGTILSSITMSIIDSAVDTIVVCFAEAPEEFEMHHPEESKDMKDAWSSVYNVTF